MYFSPEIDHTFQRPQQPPQDSVETLKPQFIASAECLLSVSDDEWL